MILIVVVHDYVDVMYYFTSQEITNNIKEYQYTKPMLYRALDSWEKSVGLYVNTKMQSRWMAGWETKQYERQCPLLAFK